jgi:hypothetical protein
MRLVGLALLLALGCGGQVRTSAPRPHDSRVLDRTEISQHYANMQDVLRRTRPNWLHRARSVFAGGMCLGSINYLTTISSNDVEAAHYLTLGDVVIQYGNRCPGPGIEIDWRRGR